MFPLEMKNFVKRARATIKFPGPMFIVRHGLHFGFLKEKSPNRLVNKYTEMQISQGYQKHEINLQ